MSLSDKIRNYVTKRGIARLEMLQKTIEKERRKPENAGSEEFEALARTRMQEESSKYEINNWLSASAAIASRAVQYLGQIQIELYPEYE